MCVTRLLSFQNYYIFRDEATQDAALKLVEEMLPHLSKTELLTILPSIQTFTTSSNAASRATMYKVFMWIYDNYRYDGVYKVLSCTMVNYNNTCYVIVLL